ncbi:MAG TPA: hypothetical protein VFA26_11485, partial [Gemmataceae bacterium]|nr:hypothetical protein [Gemmataceae bacterium]
VATVLDGSDVSRRGLAEGDELVSFAGRPMGSVNQFKNVLGLYPRGWRLPLVYRTRNDKMQTETKQVLVRLMGAIRQEIRDPDQPQPKPGPRPVPVPAGPPSPAAKFYKAKEGFANYYFNEQARDALLAGFKRHGDFTGLKGAWVLEGTCDTRGRAELFKFVVKEEEDPKTKGKRLVATFDKGGIPFKIEPLKKQDLKELKVPEGSGGLTFALFTWTQLLTVGQKGFEGDFSHGGVEPFYPPPADGIVTDWAKLRVDAEVLRTAVLGVQGKWYFSPKDQALLGFETSMEREEDPCEVYFFDYQKVDGRELPHRIEVRYGDGRYTTLHVKKYDIAAK